MNTGQGLFLRSGGPLPTGADTVTIADVPPGDALVILAAKGYFGHAEVKAGTKHTGPRLDPRVTGAISGRAARPDASPGSRVWIEVRPAALVGVEPVQGISTGWGVLPTGAVRGATTAEDGSFRIEGIGPGKYLVRARYDPLASGQLVEMKAGKDAAVKLITNATSHGTPPLREAIEQEAER